MYVTESTGMSQGLKIWSGGEDSSKGGAASPLQHAFTQLLYNDCYLYNMPTYIPAPLYTQTERLQQETR